MEPDPGSFQQEHFLKIKMIACTVEALQAIILMYQWLYLRISGFQFLAYSFGKRSEKCIHHYASYNSYCYDLFHNSIFYVVSISCWLITIKNNTNMICVDAMFRRFQKLVRFLNNSFQTNTMRTWTWLFFSKRLATYFSQQYYSRQSLWLPACLYLRIWSNNLERKWPGSICQNIG